jgi:hypothetical protein
LLENSALKIWDKWRRLVVVVPGGASHLYILNLTVNKLVCLAGVDRGGVVAVACQVWASLIPRAAEAVEGEDGARPPED